MLFSRALRRCAAGRSLPPPALRNSTPAPLLSYRSQSRWASTGSTGGANDYQFGPSNDVQPQPSTQKLAPEEEDEGGRKDGSKDGKKRGWRGSTSFKMFESSATTAASLAVLG
jgi:hypothetical protein